MAINTIYISIILIIIIGTVSANSSDNCTEALRDVPNRDGNMPEYPLPEVLPRKASQISKANEIVRKGLQQFLDLEDKSLGVYLNYILNKDPPFLDEYGQEITFYSKILEAIWQQYNETLCNNYAINQYDQDKLDLCSVARFLSHQPAVEDRITIMKRMGDALEYRCHPCTPYKRNFYGETTPPSTEDISLDMSPEEIFILCKNYDHRGELIENTTTTTSRVPSFTTQAVSTSEPNIITPGIHSSPGLDVTKPTNPSFDYSPCSHFRGIVSCDQVPIKEVQQVLHRTAFPTLFKITLVIPPYIYQESFIPENILGNKRALRISIQYPDVSCCNNYLQIDKKAFESTNTYTRDLEFRGFDCTLLDLSFLSQFNELDTLTFDDVIHVQYCLPSLPPLPRLTSLSFRHCTGLSEIYNFPLLTNGLKSVTFKNDDNTEPSFSLDYTPFNMVLTDESLERFINWLLLSSANTLERMTIANMGLVTKVPHKISSFKALRDLELRSNNISNIKSGAFSFAVPVSSLHLDGNGIKEIEPGAFQGDFKDAQVILTKNNLSRFEESVFGPMLKQMTNGNGLIMPGFLDCSEENICHLAWLRSFTVPTFSCDYITKFQSLQPAAFNHC